MKKFLIAILCILLDIAVVSMIVAAYGGEKKDNVEDGPEAPKETTTVPSETSSVEETSPDDLPDEVKGGYSVKTSLVSSGSAANYVSSGYIYYITLESRTYYFIRFDVSSLDLYSVRYVSHVSGESFYPYFANYLYSLDCSTWFELDTLCIEPDLTLKEAVIPGDNLEYINICVYTEDNAADPQRTLDAIAMASEGYPDLYITDLEG